MRLTYFEALPGSAGSSSASPRTLAAVASYQTSFLHTVPEVAFAKNRTRGRFISVFSVRFVFYRHDYTFCICISRNKRRFSVAVPEVVFVLISQLSPFRISIPAVPNVVFHRTKRRCKRRIVRKFPVPNVVFGRTRSRLYRTGSRF